MAIEVENSVPGPSTQRAIKRKLPPDSPSGEGSRQRARIADELPSSSIAPRPPIIHNGRHIPRHVLLLLLPRLLSHPPSHPWYPTSVLLQLSALRKCLALDGLAPDIECRACLGFAETGIKFIREGLQDRLREGGTASLGKNVSIEDEVRNFHHLLGIRRLRLMPVFCLPFSRWKM